MPPWKANLEPWREHLKLSKKGKFLRALSRGFLLILLVAPSFASCQTPAVQQPPLVSKVAMLAALALLPFVVMLLTSFLKMVIVLSLLRQAVGVQNAPPNQALNGIALLMAIYVMFPTALAMYKETSGYINSVASKDYPLFSTVSAENLMTLIDKGKEPMRSFLIRNSLTKHRQYFYQLARQKFPDEYKGDEIG